VKGGVITADNKVMSAKTDLIRYMLWFRFRVVSLWVEEYGNLAYNFRITGMNNFHE
jgi:hypothetical protein